MELTPRNVAQWMLQELHRRDGWLQQRDTVRGIVEQFGEEFTYQNRHGHPAISPDVLKEFRKLSRDEVVWSRSRQLWRRRQGRDRSVTRLVR